VTKSEPVAVRDPVVDAYKPGIDRTLLIENLKRTPEDRFRNLMALQTEPTIPRFRMSAAWVLISRSTSPAGRTSWKLPTP